MNEWRNGGMDEWMNKGRKGGSRDKEKRGWRMGNSGCVSFVHCNM